MNKVKLTVLKTNFYKDLAREYGKAERTMGSLCLLYEHASDKDWKTIKNTHTPTEILQEICGLQNGHLPPALNLSAYDGLKAYMAKERSTLS